MHLKTEITQVMTHKQTLTHRQQFALKILSMDDQQLQAEIEQALYENPLLEICDTIVTPSTLDSFDNALATIAKKKTLREVIEEQLHTSRQQIANDLADYLIDCLDSNGYLTVNTKEIQQLFPYDEDTIEDTIAVLQTFEPSGIFARSLQESLLIQLCNGFLPYHVNAVRIINNHLWDMAQYRWDTICQKMNITKKELRDAVDIIRSLSPRPASDYQQSAITIKPIAHIHVINDMIHIEVDQPYAKLQINPRYRQLENDMSTAYIKKHMRDAQIFLDALQKRSTTHSAILSSIVSIQKAYFLHQGSLVPLNLKDIARVVHLHESTVSRAISHNVVEFENRYIPIKTFFPARLESGQSTRSTLERIETIIKQEDRNHPLSDQDIVKQLQKEDIKISRRTVAKYRSQRKLGNALQRKKL